MCMLPLYTRATEQISIKLKWLASSERKYGTFRPIVRLCGTVARSQ